MSDLKQDLESLRLPESADQGTRKNRRRKAGAVVIFIVAIGAGTIWRSRAAPIVVDTVTPAMESAAGGAAGSPVLTASGYVVARRRAVVSAKIQGRLAELKVEEGARVNEGDIFARLESTEYQAAVSRSRAALDRAEAQIASADAHAGSARAFVARTEADLAESQRLLGIADRLAKDALLPIDQLDAARSRVRVGEAVVGQARADLQRAQADISRARAERAQADADVRYNDALLQNTNIRAPFTGTVVRKMAEVGESVAPIPPGVNISTASGAIVALADLDTLEVEVDVAEANVARLAAGQPAEVIVEAFPDRKYKGVLRQIIPTADRTRATVMTKVTILDKDANLKPEMSAKVTFLEPARAGAGAGASAPQVVVIAQNAVVSRDGVTQVFAIVDGVAQATPVKLGVTRQDRVVVLEGLTGSETLIVKPADTLKEGTRVAAKP